MLAVRRVLYVVDDRVVYLVSTGRDVLEKTASSADGVKIFELVSVLFYGLKNGFLSERSLIHHVRILRDLGRVMVDSHAHHFFFVFEYADLG